jgi:hypothetical protein
MVSFKSIHGAKITNPMGTMSLNYKRVPALDKCFSILGLMAEANRPFGFNEIVKNLGLNKSTVFNILHTLNDLGVLEKGPDALFRLGPRLFVLGNAAAGGSELIQTVHPYLETINREYRFLPGLPEKPFFHNCPKQTSMKSCRKIHPNDIRPGP